MTSYGVYTKNLSPSSSEANPFTAFFQSPRAASYLGQEALTESIRGILNSFLLSENNLRPVLLRLSQSIHKIPVGSKDVLDTEELQEVQQFEQDSLYFKETGLQQCLKLFLPVFQATSWYLIIRGALPDIAMSAYYAFTQAEARLIDDLAKKLREVVINKTDPLPANFLDDFAYNYSFLKLVGKKLSLEDKFELSLILYRVKGGQRLLSDLGYSFNLETVTQAILNIMEKNPTIELNRIPEEAVRLKKILGSLTRQEHVNVLSQLTEEQQRFCVFIGYMEGISPLNTSVLKAPGDDLSEIGATPTSPFVVSRPVNIPELKKSKNEISLKVSTPNSQEEHTVPNSDPPSSQDEMSEDEKPLSNLVDF